MSDTFELADEPEELDEPGPDEQEPRSARDPGKPLARLWKAEPDSSEEEPTSAKSKRKDKEGEPAKKSIETRGTAAKGKTKAAKAKGPPDDDEKADKKVLIEETPTLDTYETRRRARLIMGGLGVACVLLCMWIVYSVLLSDPVPTAVMTAGDGSTVPQASPEVRSTLDQEARFMYNRARELAKDGRTDQALAMLERVIKVYKGTATAKASKAALERAGNNLPLFSDRPLVVAQPEETKPTTAPAPPPAVVSAMPERPVAAQGQAVLVLPPNPSETVVITPPGAQARAAAAAPTVSSRPLPRGFQASPSAGVHQSGWPLVIVGDRDNAPMVLVPGGTFRMGSAEGQPSEAPEHQVRLSTYYIDQHEVTNRQFRRFLAEAHYRGQPPGKWLTDEKVVAESDDLPVVFVNFADAEAFATWAGKQLPTEAQWEMAARSSDGRRFPWGDESPKWSRARAFRQVDARMSFPEDQSPYGVYDMAGNVEEWTRDWFEYKYYLQFTKTIADNPTGPATNGRSRIPQRVSRGGARNWSITAREPMPADRRLPYLGFRCVLVVEDAGPAPAPVAASPGPPRGAPPGAAATKPAPPPF